jgi:preprotein translocase subunit SecE
VATVSDTRSRTPVASGGQRRTSPGLFLRQVLAELRKVVWPTQQQVVTYFFVVLVFVSVMMAYVAGLDFGLGKAMFAVFG